ncbi:MAG: phosphoenolpyruvate synthase regulatory protein [Gammaproteobacteria bacterium RIFCSPLOWO2_02_FULL_42_14]|nr:MAG: phosphoenolpyruvate synthase regulatory protein [Gammaproteobacteria bacterium RIFCSPHIGHO2_02_FULL_42_43]OGT29210.1 MAG: phosphoenolpyruvate synthase regulatory protein [Gammaproteobacteria bacterium RIFCSPHIGHO2_01_FULL_42_8]OGT52283.1 MAG: phosphoenolpyruvate synthase regulatory protein [Gammaproteobacteria bacterium RIFCSPHIGHO2_12_FULL_41_25]OGT61896.1 MAG: phosphoenolpyruvate synthase regulatory protein [Gammaproteobacteria bacterium RIFCSPLOWO2_02_FULL_42_14]OGT86394.1 MAG: phosp
MKKRHVFCISDGTGITANSLGHALLSQFEQTEFIQTSLPYIDTPEKARDVCQKIEEAFTKDQAPPIVFSTMVKPELLKIIKKSPGLTLDFLETFIDPLEKTLQEKSSHTVGRSHGMVDYATYKRRIDALNFSLNTDDGASINQYDKADVILIGVSRSGKTPTSLYLSLQFGLFVANYPITDHELESTTLPSALQPYQNKLFGLTIDVGRLMAIRSERRPNSEYASEKQCAFELNAVEKILKRAQIPYLNATHLSVEELATRILVFQSGKPHE